MQTELKKLIVFGVIIAFFTSAYAAFFKYNYETGFFNQSFLCELVKIDSKNLSVAASVHVD